MVATTEFILEVEEDVDNRLAQLSPSWKSSSAPSRRTLGGHSVRRKRKLQSPLQVVLWVVSPKLTLFDNLHSKLTLAESFTMEHDANITNRKQNDHVI